MLPLCGRHWEGKNQTKRVVGFCHGKSCRRVRIPRRDSFGFDCCPRASHSEPAKTRWIWRAAAAERRGAHLEKTDMKAAVLHNRANQPQKADKSQPTRIAVAAERPSRRGSARDSRIRPGGPRVRHRQILSGVVGYTKQRQPAKK